MDYCDLHTHSTFSDGTFSPSLIVAEGLLRKLRAVALTNHNTVARLPEFLKAAKGTEMEAIPGGISTGYREEAHIVGLLLRQEHYGELERTTALLSSKKRKATGS